MTIPCNELAGTTGAGEFILQLLFAFLKTARRSSRLSRAVVQAWALIIPAAVVAWVASRLQRRFQCRVVQLQRPFPIPTYSQSSQKEDETIPHTTAFRLRMKLVSSLPIFQEFQCADIPLLAKAMKHEVWPPGEQVMQSNEHGDKLWIIESGTAVLSWPAEKEALETTEWKSMPQIAETQLPRGGFFGVRNNWLVNPAEASVVAGRSGLQTLCISRAQMAELGLRLRRSRRLSIEKQDWLQETPKTVDQQQWLYMVLEKQLTPAFGFAPENIMLLVAACRRKVCAANECILVQGALTKLLCIIESGSCSVVHDGREIFKPTPHASPTSADDLDQNLSKKVMARPVLQRRRTWHTGEDDSFDSKVVFSKGVLEPQDVVGVSEAFLAIPNASTVTSNEECVLWILHHAAILAAFRSSRLNDNLDMPHERQCSLEELSRTHETLPSVPLLSDLKALGHIGEGAYGSVSLVGHSQSGESKLYALKTIRKQACKLRAKQHVKNEREVMGLMDSAFIIRLYATYRDQSNIFFLLELALGGNLLDAMDAMPTKLIGNELFAQFISASVALALQHMHSRKVIYRDTKPQNILFDARGYVKICDFGLAKLCIGPAFTMCGTPEYMAPEVLECIGYTAVADWWGLGVLLYEMLDGLPPFKDVGGEVLELFRSIRRGVDSIKFPVSNFSPHAEVCVRDLCTSNPAARLGSARGLDEVRHHAFFKGLDWGQLARGQLDAPFKPSIHNANDCDAHASGLPLASAIGLNHEDALLDDLADSLWCTEDALLDDVEDNVPSEESGLGNSGDSELPAHQM